MSWIVYTIVLAVALIVLAYLFYARKLTIPFIYQHNPGYTIGVVACDDPLHIQTDTIHVLHKSQFRLHPNPTIMADPFIVKDGEKMYIFYEELSAKYRHLGGADIALLSSDNGVDWRREGIVLHEPYHLSFPNVFAFQGDWYMIPEASASGKLRIYKAAHFPTRWQCVKEYDFGSYSDPMIYIDYGTKTENKNEKAEINSTENKNETAALNSAADKVENLEITSTEKIAENTESTPSLAIVYLFLNRMGKDDSLRLYYTTDLLSGFTEHPASPIRVLADSTPQNPVYTRPAGTVNTLNGELVFWLQSHAEGYGSGSIGYRIKTLSPTHYADEPLEDNPILWRNGEGWAKHGMHHLSFIPFNGQYLCALDGLHASLRWRIDWLNFPVWNK